MSSPALAGCMLWCERSRRLLWTDGARATLWTHEPASARTRSWPLPEPASAFALTGSDDRLLLAQGGSLVLFRFSTGKTSPLRALEPRYGRIVSGRCDRQGRFVFATQDAGLQRLHLDLALEPLPLPVAQADDICFSPDGRRMLFAAAGAIQYADYNPCSAEVGSLHTLAGAHGVALGATVDAAGCLWAARRMAVDGRYRLLRFAPDGRLSHSVELGSARPCCPTFGGAGLATLYVGGASAPGTAPSCPAPGAHGLPEPRFLHAG